MVTDLNFFTISVREAAQSFLISLRASNRYSPRYLEALEFPLVRLAAFAEEGEWLGLAGITAGHIEKYLVHLQSCPRWFGQRDASLRPVSQSHIETQYRRIKRFFNWSVERGLTERNPLDLIPHPHIDERVIPTISQQQSLDLLRLTDPRHSRTPGEKFRAIRNKAAIYLLLDSPGRRQEIATITLENVDLDTGAVKVMGKGRRERCMPVGTTLRQALWESIQARKTITGSHRELWVDEHGKPMKPSWLYLMLKRLGQRAGIPGLHTHQFRHTYAVATLRGGMPERVLALAGGWRKIPDTDLRTLGADDVRRFHADISPVDRLGQAQATLNRVQNRGKARGKL